MKVLANCLLCSGELNLFYKEENKQYYQCQTCSSIMLNPKDYLSSNEEKARYKTHNNDVFDKRYQNFVSPIVNAVKENYNSSHLGLDFGAGTGPVITKMLEDVGYQLNLFDPYFHNNRDNLNKTYDYIVCCEVMEHFHNPFKEFEKMSKMLNKDGSLFCMTSLYDESIDFENWHYKRDETHVFFYHKKALEWIRKKFEFKEVTTKDKFIAFKK